MSVYQVQNQWGGTSAPWHPGNTWILGGRSNQSILSVEISSKDHGDTFTGTMAYEGEGPISVKAVHVFANVYEVEVRWGGSSASWHNDGQWIIGGRTSQRAISVNVKADKQNMLNGEMTYLGEGPIGFKGTATPGYTTENQWGGTSAPWHQGGTWALSGRSNQDVIAMNISSNDHGKTLTGTMQYKGEGPIGFKGTLAEGNNYEVSNQWGGSSAPWHQGGNMIIGNRNNQNVEKLSFSSKEGERLTGEMTYTGEGPIGFKAQLQSVGVPAS